jgi:hypothetical protein
MTPAELEAKIEAYTRQNSVGQVWDRSIVPARTRERIEADIAELRRHMGDPDLLDGFISLVRQGRIINSGERRDGIIIWITPDALK